MLRLDHVLKVFGEIDLLFFTRRGQHDVIFTQLNDLFSLIEQKKPLLRCQHRRQQSLVSLDGLQELRDVKLTIEHLIRFLQQAIPLQCFIFDASIATSTATQEALLGEDFEI